MNIRRGFFRLLLIASPWMLVATIATWEELLSPSFDESTYLYLPEGWTTPKEINDPSFGIGYADPDRERAATVLRDGKVQGHFRPLDPSDLKTGRLSDYSEIRLPHDVTLWMPVSLGAAEHEEVQNRFRENYVAPRDSEALQRRLGSLGVILIPPVVLFVIAAALLWAFSGFRQER